MLALVVNRLNPVTVIGLDIVVVEATVVAEDGILLKLTARARTV